jgi:hypothetical protein
MLLELVTKPHTKSTINQIINYVGEDANIFKDLMKFFLSEDRRVTQLTSWAVGHIGENQPQLIAPFHLDLINQLKLDNKHNAIRRNIVRLYQFVPIPEEIEGELYDICMGFILDPKEAIAVKAFSMRVCELVAIKYPDLAPELMDAIEGAMIGASSGLKNRGSHTLRRLNKLINS